MDYVPVERHAMDPVTTILTALAVAGAKVGGQAITDGYAALRGLILRKFGSHRTLEPAIADYASDPEGQTQVMAEELQTAGVIDDQEVLERAQQLIRLARDADPIRTNALVNEIRARNVAVIGRNDGTITFN